MRSADKLWRLAVGILSLACLPGIALAQNAQPMPNDPRTQNSGAQNGPQSRQPAVQNPGAADAATPSSITHRDQRYFWDLSRANVTEILAARLAEAKAMRPEVRDFARQMTADHTAALEKLKQLAQKKQVVLPQQPDADQEKMLDRLTKVASKDFDGIYIREAGVKGHEDALDLLKKIQKSGHDADLKMLAEELQPTVEAHLKMVKGMAGK